MTNPSIDDMNTATGLWPRAHRPLLSRCVCCDGRRVVDGPRLFIPEEGIMIGIEIADCARCKGTGIEP